METKFAQELSERLKGSEIEEGLALLDNEFGVEFWCGDGEPTDYPEYGKDCIKIEFPICPDDYAPLHEKGISSIYVQYFISITDAELEYYQEEIGSEEDTMDDFIEYLQQNPHEIFENCGNSKISWDVLLEDGCAFFRDGIHSNEVYEQIKNKERNFF